MSSADVRNRVVPLLSFAVVVRLSTLILALVADAVAPDYDRSGSRPLVRWDSVFFVDIAEHGYRFEKQYAFQPALPIAMKFLTSTVLSPLLSVYDERFTLAIAGLIICNVSFVLAAWSLYRLSVSILRDEKLAYRSTLFFCLSPAGIFLSAIYTESIFALFCFAGFQLLYAEKKRWASAVMFALATAVRGNGIVLIGFFLFEALQLSIKEAPRNRRRAISNFIFVSVRALFLCLTVLLPNVLFQYYGYARFCSAGTDARPYCNKLIPSIYSFVQDHYWNNGFLRYWTLKQLPNFVLASPILLLSARAIISYCSADLSTVLSAGLSKTSSKRPFSGFHNLQVLCFIYYWSILVVALLLFFHVQISTRFLSSCPPVYWYCASLCSGRVAARNTKLLLSYCAVYIVVGTSLFANFYPWT